MGNSRLHDAAPGGSSTAGPQLGESLADARTRWALVVIVAALAIAVVVAAVAGSA
jgi:hypothetical protein